MREAPGAGLGRDGGWAWGTALQGGWARWSKAHLGSCWILEGVCSAVRRQPAGPAKSEPAPASATTARSDTPAQAGEVVDESIDERVFVIYLSMFCEPPAVTRTGELCNQQARFRDQPLRDGRKSEAARLCNPAGL